MPRETMGRQLDPGVIAALGGRLKQTGGIIRTAITGVTDAWFGPSQPLKPTAPEDVKGRAFQTPFGYNLMSASGRWPEDISYTELRQMARNLDIVNLAIDTRKDQLERLAWGFRLKDDTLSMGERSKDPRIKELIEFFSTPDPVAGLSFRRWLRKQNDDLLICDAPTLYVQRTRGGKPFRMKVLDCNTVRPLMNAAGDRPQPPDPAYQQWLYGVPAADFTADEILSIPRNPRPDKFFGFPPVEQIYITVQQSLRRAALVLAGFTEGTIPEMIVPVPEDWTVDQIRSYQEYWDSLFTGNLAEQRKARFVAAGMDKAVFPKKFDDLNSFDEWLARIVCFAYSLPPTPFVKMINRATAEQSNDTALKEGLETFTVYWEEVINVAIVRYWGWKDIEFFFRLANQTDELKAAQADQVRTDSGHMTIDEVRKARGLEPVGADRLMVKTATGMVPVPITPEEIEAARAGAGQSAALDVQGVEAGGRGKTTQRLPGLPAGAKKPKDEGDDVTDELEKLLKAAGSRKVKKFRMSPMKAPGAEGKLAAVVGNFLAAQGRKISKAVAKAYDKAVKVDDDRVARILEELDLTGWSFLVDPAAQLLELVAQKGGAMSLAQLGIREEGMFDTVDKAATEWAWDRAAEMVGKKWIGEDLVDNPDASWAITDSTRDMIKQRVTVAVENGESSQDLAKSLEDGFTFSKDRALGIARTELANAHVGGNMLGWKESGLVQRKRSVLGSEHEIEDECDVNAAEGWIPFDQAFSSGDEAAPYHTRCVCDVEVEAVLPAEAEAEE